MLTLRSVRALALALVWALSATACDSQSSNEADEPTEYFPLDDGKADGLGKPSVGPKARYRGQTEFVSAAPFYRIFHPWLRTSAAELEDASAKDKPREVVESDVYRVENGYLYVLNAYRGLQVINVTKPDKPRLVGRADIWGRPFEMYVRGNRAYLLVTDHYRYENERAFHGSRVVTVDLSVRSRPRVIGSLDVAGNITDSRLVGDVIYVVSTEWPEYDYAKGAQAQETTHVVSVNIRTSRPSEVERTAFPGAAYFIHASSDYLFLAQTDYANGGTNVKTLGISDPRGHIVDGAAVRVPGYLQDRFQMNYDKGYLRLVTHHWQGNGTVFVATARVDSPTEVALEGQLELPSVGQLLATKFDGDRAYLVHIVRVDPLDVIDLSDPKHPTRLSSLEIPGWLEHLEVRGNRVLGIGVDNSAGQNQLAVAMYDVTDPAATRETARAILQEGWAWSSGFSDDRAFRLINDDGILLVPFSAWSEAASVQAVQLVDVNFVNATLELRGRIEQAGEVRRAVELGSRVGAFSDRELRVANIDDRDNPILTATLELARNVRSFVALPTCGLQLVGEWNETPELRAVPVAKPDAERAQTLSLVSLDKGTQKVFASGDLAVTVSYGVEGDQRTVTLSAIDYLSPWSPKTRGSVTLPLGDVTVIEPWFRRVNISDVVQLGEELFAVANVTGAGREFSVVSFANPRAPRVVYATVLEAKGQYIDMRVFDRAMYVTHFEEIPEDKPEEIPGEPTLAADSGASAESRIARPWPQPTTQYGKYYVTRLGVSFGGRFSVSPSINIPGRLVDVDSYGNLITLDQRWGNDDGTPHQHKHLTTLTFDFARRVARLRDLLNVDEGVSDVRVSDGAAFFTTYGTSWSFPVVLDEVPVKPEPAKWELHAVDVRRGGRLREASHTVIQRDGSGALLAVDTVGESRLAFLTLGFGGLAVYDVTDSTLPEQISFVPANGWSSEIVVDAEAHVAYTWSGYFGVRSIDLP